MPPVAAADSYTFSPGTTLYAGMETPSSGALATTFTLENFSAGSTRTLFRGGMPFKKGDVPSGSVPEIRRAGGAPVVAQFDERTTWSDGSLKFAICHMRDTDLAGMASQEYEIYSVTGSFNNTGATTLASVVASDALTVEFSSLAQWNGTSSATRGAGAALAAFATHAGVATRATKIHSGPVCEGWQVWGMAKDGAAGAGAEDAHLKTIWHVDVWKDAGGDVIDTEFAAELAQDWWAVASKFRLDYTATLKRNGSTVQAYTGIQHPYHSRWLTARTQNDNHHAKRHWVGAVPSLVYKFDKDYWVSTGLVPPFDTAYTPDANGAVTFVPLGNMGHRADLDGTGAYMGRGIFPNNDCATFMRQTASDARSTRTQAMAGLHVNKHYRDERTRARPSESADVANTIVPLLWEPKASSASTFTGLPTPKHAYSGSASSSGDKGGFVDPSGGLGVWTSTINASHAPSFSAFAYMLEGERYFLETTYDLATFNTQCGNADIYASKPYIHWYESPEARAEMSIPATQYSAIPSFSQQERDIGWASNILAHAAALAPDNDPQGQYIKGWNSHCADFLDDAVTYSPPSIEAAGLTVNSLLFTNGTMRNPWQTAFIIKGCCQNYLSTEEVGFKNYAEMVARSTAAMKARSLYDLESLYRVVNATTAVWYDSGNYLPANGYLFPFGCTVTSNVLELGGSLPALVKNNDKVYFFERSGDPSTVALPSGYTAGTPLYVINTSGTTCQVSLSIGGSVFSVPNGSYAMAGECTGRAAINPAVNPPRLPNADDYSPIHLSAFAMAEVAGLSTVPAGTAADVEAFLANVDRTAQPSWVMKVPA